MRARQNFWIHGALVLFAAALCIVMAEAQSVGHGRHGQNVSVTGCLSRTSTGHFKLVSRDGRAYRVESRKLSLSRHVGHQVILTGYVLHSSRAAAQPARRSGAHDRLHRLRAFRLKMVSQTCHRR